MPSIQEWFNVYAGIRDNVAAVNGAVGGARDNLGSILAQLRDTTNPDINAIGEHLSSISKTLAGLDLSLEVDPEPLVTVINDQLSAGANTFGTEFSLKMGSLLKRLGTEALPLNVPLYDISASLQGGLADPESPLAKGMGALEKIAAELLEESSPALIPLFRKLLNLILKEPVTLVIGLASLAQFLDESSQTGIAKWVEEKLGATLARGIALGRPIMSALELPLELIIKTGLDEFRKELESNAPADPSKVRDVAAGAIGKAYALGQGAHFLAIAAELWPPLKSLGLSAAAAALVDLAGFKPMTDAISKASIGAALTRPMRWWGNMTFQPEIPRIGDLIELVQKREMDLETMSGFMTMHGFRKEDIDIFTRAVWREPTIRDLALSLEDVSVDTEWLSQRVRRAGYHDDDAEKLTGALIQRIVKTSRATLISAGRGAVADGSLDLESFQIMLEGLGLRPDIIDLESRAAGIQARRDYIRDAIATYRRQYINDVIDEGSFALALSTLGVAPDRADLILADANAARAPKIATEEERAIQAGVREIQRELVPRYRRLFEMGAIDEGAYREILILAGVSPVVAGQAVILDRQKRDLIAQKSGQVAFERDIDRLISETEELLKLQFRKGLIDLAALGSQLSALGIPPERVRIIEEQERARAYQPPGREIPRPDEAKDRLLADLRVQTATNDFRRGRIGPQDLFDEMVAAGLDEDEAIARVNLELARLPAPSAPRAG